MTYEYELGLLYRVTGYDKRGRVIARRIVAAEDRGVAIRGFNNRYRSLELLDQGRTKAKPMNPASVDPILFVREFQ